MTGPAQTFQLAAVEPGRFDVESSFIEPEKQSLHVLARVEAAQDPGQERRTPGRTAPAWRLQHRRRGAGQERLWSRARPQQNSRRRRRAKNTFKHKRLDLNAKNVQIYLYGNKNSPYEVALIFEYPKAEDNSVNPKIGLCLESFAVGEKAKRAFAGGETEEAGGKGPAKKHHRLFLIGSRR